MLFSLLVVLAAAQEDRTSYNPVYVKSFQKKRKPFSVSNEQQIRLASRIMALVTTTGTAITMEVTAVVMAVAVMVVVMEEVMEVVMVVVMVEVMVVVVMAVVMAAPLKEVCSNSSIYTLNLYCLAACNTCANTGCPTGQTCNRAYDPYNPQNPYTNMNSCYG